MNRRSFFKKIATIIVAPTIFIPKIIVPKWKPIQLSTVGSFDSFIFPVICNKVPSICVNEFINIQPMSSPSGTIFYMDFVTTSKFDESLII